MPRCPATGSAPSARLCRHPAKTHQVRCEDCAKYNGMLPDKLKDLCGTLDHMRSQRMPSVVSYETYVSKVIRFAIDAMAAGSLHMDAPTRARFLLAIRSGNAAESCAALSTEEVDVDTFDPIDRLVNSDEPSTILEAVSLAYEQKNSILRADMPIIKLFVKCARVFPSMRAHAAIVLKKMIFEEDLDVRESRFAISVILNPSINDDFENGLRIIIRRSLLVHHAMSVQDVSRDASRKPLLTYEEQSELRALLIG